MNKQELKQNYDNACNAYLEAFCKQYHIPYDNRGNKMWVSCEPGGIYDMEDMCFGMEEIKLCVDKQVTWDDVTEWQDYNSDASYLGLNYINLRSWLMGCPRTSKEKRAELYAMRRNFEELINEENERNKK